MAIDPRCERAHPLLEIRLMNTLLRLPGIALLGALILPAEVAEADGASLYLGAGFADSTLELGEDEVSLGTVSAKLGFQLGRFFAIEADLGAMSDDSSSILSESVASYQALMARLGVTVDRTMVYVLAGQARKEIDRNTLFGPGSGGTSNETVNVLGAGINLFGNETTGINFEVRYYGDGDLSSAHIGVQHFLGGFR